MLAFWASIFFVTVVGYISSYVASGILTVVACWLSATRSMRTTLRRYGSKLHDLWRLYQLLSVGDVLLRAKRHYALVPRQAARPQLPPDHTLSALQFKGLLR